MASLSRNELIRHVAFNFWRTEFILGYTKTHLRFLSLLNTEMMRYLWFFIAENKDPLSQQIQYNFYGLATKGAMASAVTAFWRSYPECFGISTWKAKLFTWKMLVSHFFIFWYSQYNRNLIKWCICIIINHSLYIYIYIYIYTVL